MSDLLRNNKIRSCPRVTDQLWKREYIPYVWKMENYSYAYVFQELTPITGIQKQKIKS